MEFETRAIHAGQEPDPATGALTTPIYQTSTFAQEAVGVHKGYDYARVVEPDANRARGVPRLAGERRARSRVLVRPRRDDVDHAPARPRRPRRLRERRVRRHLPHVLAGLRAEGLPLHLRDPRRALGRPGGAPRRRAARLDRDADQPAAQPRRHRGRRSRDARRRRPARRRHTFATPYLQNPLDLGADIVVHSTTKYLGGHSDVIGGFAGTNDPTIAERLRFLQKSLGAVPGPFDAWLVLRGVKTLAVRMDRHCANARARRRVPPGPTRASTQVLWPGLPDHPGHEVAARQMRDFGGMVSFLVESEEEAVELVAQTSVWTLAESLGGVESLIEHPARMTHASTAAGPFASPANLVRLSVGIESARRPRRRPRPRAGAGSGASVDLASSTSARRTRIGVRHSFCQGRACRFRADSSTSAGTSAASRRDISC